ncbi:MAG: hypothetical protein KDC65_02655 [Saprospiraceae bacterium]|nr:hypothetical protein [Saprospiraceae bacterium]
MKKTILVFTILLAFKSLIFAQPAPGPGEKQGERIAERVESTETSSSDQKALVKEIAETARAAGKDNPNDPDKVKDAVRDKLDEIRDRKSTKDKPGGKNNKEIEEWVKKLKRDLMDNSYVALPPASDTPLLCSATGTGRTTGHIADLSLYNPTDQAITAEVSPGFIPSDGRFQPYVSTTDVVVTVPPHSTANIPIEGYCADIFKQPVPAGVEMPALDEWITASGNSDLAGNWQPQSSEGWKPNPASGLTVPGTDRPMPFSIDLYAHPEEAASVLLEALSCISTAYDDMKARGVIETPFSGQPDKEREAVIQQTFWVYCATLTGKEYKLDDFSKNTRTQFEANTGQDLNNAAPETKAGLDQGIAGFWGTFQAVGAEAKVLANDQPAQKDDWGPVVEQKYRVYAAYREMGYDHDRALRSAVPNEAVRREWGEKFRRRYEGK